MPEKSAFFIRKGNPEDVPSALELIRELAVFENEPDAVVVSETEMLADGFGPNPVFDFYVAEIDTTIVGLALYYYKYSTWTGRCMYLEDLIVTKAFRGKGIGKALMQKLIDLAAHEKVRRLEWQVLDWNAPAINFYKTLDAELDAEWINCELTLDKLQLLASKQNKG